MTRKRKYSKGEGSISKRVKNGKTYWQGYVTVGFDNSTGKQIKETFNATSEKEAKAKRDEILKKVNENVDILTTKNKTAADFIKEYIDNFMQSEEIRRQSYLLYCSYHRLYIKDSVFGKMEMDKVETRHLQLLVSELSKKGFAPKTIKNIFIPIKTAFKYAADEKYIIKNPCNKNLKLPKVRETEFQTFTLEQVETIRKNATKQEYYVAFRLLMQGLRISELLGLRWQDFSSEGKYIYVNKQIYFEKGKEAEVIDLKTDSSRRYITLSDEVVELLKEHKEKQDKLKRLSDKPKEFNKLNLIITTKKGKALRQAGLRISFNRMLQKLKLPIIRVHDNRHTFGTLALQVTDIKSVSSMLGHSNISTTSRYLHSNIEEQRKAVAKMGL